MMKPGAGLATSMPWAPRESTWSSCDKYWTTPRLQPREPPGSIRSYPSSRRNPRRMPRCPATPQRREPGRHTMSGPFTAAASTLMALTFAAPAAAQEAASMTVQQVYEKCPAALYRYAPSLTTTRERFQHRNDTLVRSGLTATQVHRISEAIQHDDCAEAEANSALDADDEPETPPHQRQPAPETPP